ncbi:MAG TPA: hypothetical protein VF670_19255 [Duganella sp.]|jgi:uncharacterized membrane protein
MDKPDFSRYSQEQLRQILTRLDVVRYPERAQDVEQRLAALDKQSSAAVSAADFPIGERERISSNISLAMNKLIVLVCIGFCLASFVSFVFSPEKQSTGWVMAIVFFVLGILGILGASAINRYIEEVFLVEDWLILVQQGRKACVALTSIDSVEVVDNDGISVVLRLSSVNEFGQCIEFVPATGFISNPFKEIPVVDELKARIAAAKVRATELAIAVELASG